MYAYICIVCTKHGFPFIFQIFSSNADSFLGKLYEYWNFSMFNRLDVAMMIVALIGFSLRVVTYVNNEYFVYAKTIYAINCVLFYLRVMRLYSVNSSMGPKLVMIKLMVSFLPIILYKYKININVFYCN